MVAVEEAEYDGTRNVVVVARLLEVAEFVLLALFGVMEPRAIIEATAIRRRAIMTETTPTVLRT